MKWTALLIACMVILTESTEEWKLDRAWLSMSEQQRYEADTEYKARACGLTEEEFILFSSVVEAESDRSNNIEGRILIAETILNRVESESWPNTIAGVVTQPGQFSVVSSGTVCANRTNLSDAAVLEAFNEVASGEAPHVMYFNCIGYGVGEPYMCVGGNYFTVT